MTDNRLPTSIRRKLRELAGMAYERELSRELEKLGTDFDAWKEGKVNAFELSERIHRFHQGPARDLYVSARGIKPDVSVARAVAAGILTRDEVPDEVLAAVERLIDFFAEQKSGG